MASLPQAPPEVGPAQRPGPPAVQQVRRTRRPSGEAPPLPHHLNASGKWWLGLSGLVVVAWAVVIATRTVSVCDVVDTRVLQAIAGLRTPWLTRVAEVAGLPATPWALQFLWLANVVVLVVVRRWRHLFVWVGVFLAAAPLGGWMAGALQRPRPYGVQILGPWAGFSFPSLPMLLLSAFLVSTVYSLVPAGRSRTIGKWAIGVLIVLAGPARVYPAPGPPPPLPARGGPGVTLP